MCGFAEVSTAETSEPHKSEIKGVETRNLRLAQGQSFAIPEGEKQLSQDSRKNSQGSLITEVIVTATKRDESLQDIPLSVSVLDEQQLIKQGAIDFDDYAAGIPNLSFGATGDGALAVYSMQIRGVAGVGTTGFYIDDVPIPTNMNPKVMDISRIEVLRGPQGSLYGARSMGGTVRLITKRADPTRKEFNVHTTLSDVAEGESDYAADAAFNLPIAGNAALRGNAYYLRDSGVHEVAVDNRNVVGDEILRKNVDEGEYWGLQAMVTWNVTDKFTVEPRFMYQKSHIDWVPYSDFDPGNFTNSRVADLADPNDEHWSIGSLTLTWDTDWGRFTSATGLFRRMQDNREEMSEFTNFFSTVFGGDPNYYPPGGLLLYAPDDTRSTTEELRFTSNFQGRLQLTAGAFYSDDDIDSPVPCALAVGLDDAIPSIPFGTDCVISASVSRQVEELAFFGELEFAVRDNLFLTAGGRYFDNTVQDSSLVSGMVVDYGAPSRPGYEQKQNETGFNPKLALKWHVNEDWTMYGSAAKGFNVGGTNGPIPGELCGAELAALGISGAPDTYSSDSLWSYEIGSKSAHAGGRFALNASLFLLHWKDIIQTTSLSCGFLLTYNAGTAESKGVEVEISGRPIDSLTYSLGAGYTDAEFTDPQGAPGILKGDPLPQVPEWTFTGNTEYRFNVGGHESYFFLSYRWIDNSISVNGGRDNPRVRDSYDLLDARLGMTFGSWDVSLFGKNLANTHANLSDNVSLAAETPGRTRYVINRPRTIGVDIRWVF